MGSVTLIDPSSFKSQPPGRGGRLRRNWYWRMVITSVRSIAPLRSASSVEPGAPVGEAPRERPGLPVDVLDPHVTAPGAPGGASTVIVPEDTSSDFTGAGGVPKEDLGAVVEPVPWTAHRGPSGRRSAAGLQRERLRRVPAHVPVDDSAPCCPEEPPRSRRRRRSGRWTPALRREGRRRLPARGTAAPGQFGSRSRRGSEESRYPSSPPTWD